MNSNNNSTLNKTQHKLIITEKPSVAQQFASVLGVKRTSKTDGYIEDENYVVTWCVGHLVSMLYPEAYGEQYKKWGLEVLPFLPDEYKYGVIASVKKQYAVVHKMLHRNDIDTVYWAGDAGREGQVIEENIRRFGGVRSGMKELRVWIDSQTADEIKRGMREAKPMTAYDLIASSGIMRAIEDYAMGINFSRSLTLKYGALLNNAASLQKNTAISVGRVMTCVLGMVVSRERAIRDFKEEVFYKIVGNFGDNVQAEWKFTEKSSCYGNQNLFKDCGFLKKADADNFISFLNGKVAKIENVEVKNSKKAAPLLFNLAELQNICAKRFKISPDETLSIAQTLYEKKLTTYPRTDARVLSTAVAVEISKNIRGIHNGYSNTSKYTDVILNEELYRNISNSKYTNDSKITDHYAIIPTGDTAEIASLSKLQADVYDLIVRRFLSIFYPAATYKTVNISFMVDNELFTTSSKCLVDKGYLDIINISDDEDDDSSKFDNKLLPFANSVKIGDAVKVNGYDTKEGKTSPPNRYNSGSLILAMENAGNLIEDEELRSQIKGSGIGTSATRGEILKKLTNIGYLNINKSQVVTPCNFGEMVYEVVKLTIPEMLNPELSAIWDKELEEIANGSISFSSYKMKLDNYIRDKTNTIKKEDKLNDIATNIKSFATGSLSNEMSSNRHVLDGCKCPLCGGDIVTTSFGYGCSNYKEKNCKFSIGHTINSKIISEKNVKDLINKGVTPLIKGFVSKSGNKFDAMLKLDNGNIKFEFPEVKDEKSSIKCPHCNKNLVVNKWYYQCSCGFKIPHVICGKNLSEQDMGSLINDKKTGLIRGFVSKSGNKFNAYLVLEDNKIKFEF